MKSLLVLVLVFINSIVFGNDKNVEFYLNNLISSLETQRFTIDQNKLRLSDHYNGGFRFISKTPPIYMCYEFSGRVSSIRGDQQCPLAPTPGLVEEGKKIANNLRIVKPLIFQTITELKKQPILQGFREYHLFITTFEPDNGITINLRVEKMIGHHVSCNLMFEINKQSKMIAFDQMKPGNIFPGVWCETD